MKIRRNRIKRPLLFGLFTCLSVSAVVFAFLLGIRYASTEPTAQEQVTATIPVWVEAEKRQVDTALTLSGIAQAARTTALLPNTEESNMVLSVAQQPGDTLASGDLLGIVGGEPIFVLEPPLPLYRNLHLGDRGEDVKYLQRAISAIGYSTNTNGEVTQATLAAIEALYRSESLEIPKDGIETIEYRNFLAIPEGGRVVIATAQVGDTITAENPLITLENKPPYVEARLPLEQVGQVELGQEFALHTSQGETIGVISEIGEFLAPTNELAAAYRLIVQVKDPAVLVPGQTLSMSRGETQDEVLALPSSAIKEDSEGTYVLAEIDSESGQTQRTPVTVLRSADGYTAIEAELRLGQRVLLQ